MKKLTTWSALVLLLFSACEKVAKIDVPVTPPMMAVFAFVEDGQPLGIKLEEVVPLFGKPARDPGPVTGATIVVKEGAQSYLFTEGSIPGYYENNTFVGQAGKQYELEVIHSSFPSLYASCSVPTYSPASVKMQYLSTSSDLYSGSDSVRRVGFRWVDELGQVNFYRFGGELSGDQGSVSLYFSDKNLSDKAQDGIEVFSGLGSGYGPAGMQSPTTLKARFDLMTLDEHAARYLKTFDANSFGADNPFSEPVIMYSNIKGGLGIFGGVKRAYYEVQVY